MENELSLMSDEDYKRDFVHKGTKTVDLSECLSSELAIEQDHFRMPYGFKAEQEELRKYQKRIEEVERKGGFAMLIRHDFYMERKELDKRKEVKMKINEFRPEGANRYDFVGTSQSVSPDQKGNVRIHYFQI